MHDRHTAHETYRLTCDQYDAMLDRASGRCERCRTTPHAVIDHDHQRGNHHPRGLVCRSCNARLGLVDSGRVEADDLDVAYLGAAWTLAHGPGRMGRRTRPRRQTITARVDQRLVAKVADWGTLDHLTLSEVVRFALRVLAANDHLPRPSWGQVEVGAPPNILASAYPPTVIEAARAKAAAEDVNLSDVLRDLLEQWVEENTDQ